MGERGSSFKSKSNVKLVDKIDIKDKKIVNSYCEQTLNYLSSITDKEECVIITKSGKVYHFKGDSKYDVAVPDKYNAMAKYDLHSHPHDAIRSFSKQDISNWRKGVTYFVTDRKYDYRAYVKEDIPYNPHLLIEAYSYAKEIGIKTDEEQDLQCLYLQSKGYIDYEKMVRHS